MPPPVELSDEESIAEEIPHRTTKNGDKVEQAESKDQSGEEDEDEDEEEEVYVVESILDHHIVDGIVKYEVKWLGYNRKEDNSWEPEENLGGAKDLLQEYYEKMGGKPTVPSKKDKKRGRPSQSDTPESTTAKKAKQSRLSQSKVKADSPATTPLEKIKGQDWTPPKGTWDGKVQHVETIRQDEDGSLQVFLMWNDGKQSKHPVEKCYEKCPQTMLKFYEAHLVFTTNKEEAANGQ